MPRELLEKGITSESELVAYLKAQNEVSQAPHEEEAGQKRVKEESNNANSNNDGGHNNISNSDGTTSKRAKASDDGEPAGAAVTVAGAAALSGAATGGRDAALGASLGLDSSDDDGNDNNAAQNVDNDDDDDLAEVDLDGFVASNYATEWSALELGIMREALREFGPDFDRVSQQLGKTADECKACYALNEKRLQRLLRRRRTKPDEGEINSALCCCGCVELLTHSARRGRCVERRREGAVSTAGDEPWRQLDGAGAAVARQK